MLKIVTEKGTGAGITLRLEGQVIGPWVDELRSACEPLVGNGSGVTLDLASVSFVSREGARLLASLGDRRVALVGCSGFVAEQLRADREAGR